MRIGIYCRVSSYSQKSEGYSIDNQRVRGIEYCDKMGYDYEIFEDVISGSIVNRKGLDELFGKVLMGEINGMLFYEWSRLVRDKRLMVKLEDLLKEKRDCKVIVDGKERDILEDDGDRIEYEVGGFLSSYERFRLMKRVKDGSINRMKDGYVRCKVKFGLKKIKGEVFIDEGEDSKIVEDIFKMFLYKNINNIKELTIKINKKWNKKYLDSSMKRWLVYEGYNGRINQKYKDFKIETKIVKLIDDETFKLVGEKINKIYSKRKGRDNSEYLLKGLVNCGSCGSRMYKYGSVSKKSYKRNKDGSKRKSYGLENKYVREFYYYSCGKSGYKKVNESEEEYLERKNECNSYKRNSINFGIIDIIVWEGLFKFLNKSDTLLESYKKKKLDEVKKLGLNKGKKKYYEKNIDELKKSKYDLFKKYSKGIIEEDDYKLYNGEFDIEINNNENRLRDLNEYEINEVDDKLLENVLEVLKNDLDNKKKIGDKYFKIKRIEGEEDESYYKRKNVGLKDMRRIIDKYLSKISIKRLGEEEYNINFDFSIKLSNNEKDIFKNMMLENGNKLFYIKISNIYLLFSYIEEIVWNCKFVFRYNRVNKLGKTFLYKFDIGNEEVEVLNKVN